MMNPHRRKLTSVAWLGAAASAVVALVMVACVALEYQYAQHYFFVQGAWYTVTFPWNWLNFAFFVRSGNTYPESTLLLAASSGIGGAVLWRCMTRVDYSRGVAAALAAAFVAAYLASWVAWSATFSELLVLHMCQALIVIAFFTFVRRADGARGLVSNGGRTSRGPRFSLRELLILPALFAGILAGAKFIDPRGIGSVLVGPYGKINVWLPILGCSTALATLLFASSYQASGRARFGRLVLSIAGTAVFGWGLASVYPSLPVLWSTYIGSYAPGSFTTFPYAYAVWLPLLGVFTIVTLASWKVATRIWPVFVAAWVARRCAWKAEHP